MCYINLFLSTAQEINNKSYVRLQIIYNSSTDHLSSVWFFFEGGGGGKGENVNYVCVFPYKLIWSTQSNFYF